MNRILFALAVSFSLLAVTGVGYLLTSNLKDPDTSGRVELDRLHARLNDLEESLESLATGMATRSMRVSQSLAASENAEVGPADGDASTAAEGALLARLETLETRLLALEGDPVQRAFTYLESENPELRRRGVHTLEALARSDPEARAALREMLKDPDAGVSIAALHTLAEIGDKDFIPLAVGLLDDENAHVRREAINTLTRLGTKEAAAEIAPLIADENDEVRRLAADSVGKLRYEDSAAALLSALEDPNLGVRGEAISSLGEVGATESLSRLRELYAEQTENGAHREADHRVRLAMAMKQLGDKTAVEAEIDRLGKHIHYENNGGAMRALMWIGHDEPLAREVFRRAAEVSDTEWIRREARRMLQSEKSE